LGIGPSRIGKTIGVVKAYTTRVGNGPFPSELSEAERLRFPDHQFSREIGTTTGRKRRLGWFDACLARHAVCLNGIDSLAITKIDILDQMDEIRICTGYKNCSYFPVTQEELAHVEPIYETHPGWKESTRDVRIYKDLPALAKAYLRRIEALCAVPISIVSVGPEREKTIWLDRFYGEL
jgi:adenylosuccinate synthase